jgi:hypothetical protein
MENPRHILTEDLTASSFFELTKDTYTLWWKDGNREEGLTAHEVIKKSESLDFSLMDLRCNGEVFFWEHGVEPYDNPRSTSDDVAGGIFVEDRSYTAE